jgi:hypothetical protein
MADSKGLAAPRSAVLLAAGLFFGLLLVAGVPGTALADDSCKAVALTQVPPDGATDPTVIATESLKSGEIDEAISGYRVDKRTALGVFSARGGVAYPRFLVRGGQRVEALRLTNCRIGPKASETWDEVDYDVVFDPPLSSAPHLEQAPAQAVAEARQKPTQAPKGFWYVIDEGGPTHDRCAPITTFAVQSGVPLSPTQAASSLAPRILVYRMSQPGNPAGWWQVFLGGEKAIFTNGRTLDFVAGLKPCKFMNSPGYRATHGMRGD